MDDSEDLRRRLQIETRSGSASRPPAEGPLVPGPTVLDAMAEELEVSKRGLQRRMKQLGIYSAA